MADHGDGLAFVEADAIENLRMGGHFVMSRDRAIEIGVDVENAGNAANAGEHTILLCQHHGCGALVGIDAGVTGGVAGGTVFDQRVLDNCGYASAMPVHRNRRWSLVVRKIMGACSVLPACSRPSRAELAILPPSCADHPQLWPELSTRNLRCSTAADRWRFLFPSSPTLSSDA